MNKMDTVRVSTSTCMENEMNAIMEFMLARRLRALEDFSALLYWTYIHGCKRRNICRDVY